MKNMSSKISGFAISLFLGAIIISFALTGFTTLGTSNSVADVDGTPVTIEEYRRAYNQRLNEFTQRMGGKSLTSQQIKMFRIKEGVLQQLITQKLFLNYADKMNLSAGKLAIKNEIKKYPAFQTAGKFDVSKYKLILKQMRLSPSKFESEITAQVKSFNLTRVISSGSISKNAATDLLKFKNMKAKVTAVAFEKEAMTAYLNAPKAKVDEFLNKKENLTLLNSLYQTYKAEREANKQKVEKIDAVKTDLAKKHIQKTMRAELQEFNKKLKADLTAALSSNDNRTLKKLQKKYGLTLEQNAELDLFNLAVKTVKVDEDNALEIFKSKDTAKVIENDSPTMISLVRAQSFSNAKVKDEDLKKEIELARNKASYEYQGAILKLQQDNSKIVRTNNLL